MAKKKYRFNPESLSFDTVRGGFKKTILKAVPMLLFVIVTSLVLEFFVFGYFVDSPQERKLKREVTQLKVQYERMNNELAKANDVLANIQYRDDNIYRTIFESEPIPEGVRKAWSGGVNRYAYLQGFENSEIVIETSKKLDMLLTQLYIQSKSYDEVEHLATNKGKYLACIPSVQPILNKDLTHVASHFGWRTDPVYRTKKFHEGIDFTAPVGTDVFATGDGVVGKIVAANQGYGNQIVIDHGFGYKTRYAHLSRIFVKEGDNVRRGEMIGLVGNTGKSVGPHLHYEVLKNDKAINPINYFYLDLSPGEYDRMIELSSTEGGQTLD